MVSETLTDFGRPLRNSSWSDLWPGMNSPYYRQTLVLNGATSPEIELSSSMHC